MERRFVFALAALLPMASSAIAGDALDDRFDSTVRPFLAAYCVGCHGPDRSEAKLDLSGFTASAQVARDHVTWETVRERVEAGEMPPDSARRKPTDKERLAFVQWIAEFRDREAERNAGDPGIVLARRLSNAEFDYTIRDLTGVDIRPTREFPVDPANEAGFDNSGESLAMSPALFRKFLSAARHISDHVVLKPDGFDFAPHPVVTDTDRDKYCVQRIVEFYQRHEVDYADYFLAAWRFRHRAALGQPNATLEDISSQAGLSARYLATVWSILSPAASVPQERNPERTTFPGGPLAAIRSLWNDLPAPVSRDPDIARPGCERMKEFVTRLRKDLVTPIDRLHVEGISDGSQPLVLWKNRRQAEQRMTHNGRNLFKGTRPFELKLERPDEELVLHFFVEPVGPEEGRSLVIWKSPRLDWIGRDSRDTGEKRRKTITLRELLEQHVPDELAKVGFGKHPDGETLEGDSFVLAAGTSLTVRVPAKALYQARRDAWKLVTTAVLSPRAAGGAVRADCMDWIPDPALIAEQVAREAYLVREDHPAARALQASFVEFCRVFPDQFFVSDRKPYFESGEGGSGRLLTAGFHLMQGYFRDDAPLYELILDERDRAELDALWQELDVVTNVPARQYKDFIFFERAEPPRFLSDAEFDFARSEDKDAVSEAGMTRLAELYLAKARRLGARDEALDAIRTYFTRISTDIRRVETARRTAEPAHLRTLLEFAGRAWRRRLSDSESDELLAFYRTLRERDQLDHEDALRDTIASVLISPHFCYRFDQARETGGKESRLIRPLSDDELASRLSYFLWSSMPDQELLAHASAGRLHEPEVLLAQARRMLRDPRVRGLALEFAGNWLDIRRFEELNTVDRERFPTFTNELRQAMFEEPIRFFLDVIQHDRSILDLLYADHTFVNAELARHYRLPVPSLGPDGWGRVDDASPHGRGGLLPMAAFLTKNSPGLRTSPVKRGYWVVRRLLGEHIPPPPPEVPELPKDEAALGELTLRQVLARHREHKNCAACHVRFDSIGLAFESYGPTGERRELDLGGRPVQDTAEFPDGTRGTGLEGLRQYLREHREPEFVDTFCRKLLSYALGRSLLLSDRKTLENMRGRLAANEHRFMGLVESIVTSPQFLRKRSE